MSRSGGQAKVWLEFPNSNNESAALREGVNLVGSGSDCQVLLRGSGIAVHHCEIELRDGDAVLRAEHAWATTVLNGRRVEAESSIKPGDVLLFGRVGCQVLSGGKPLPVTATRERPQPAADSVRETSRTQVRGVVPSLVLRGLSGPVFGRSFALRDGLLIGRSRDCDVCVQMQEISRQHTRLRIIAQQVVVEDLGSTNGTFINGLRISGSRTLEPGDELGIDTVRFTLISPGASSTTTDAKPVGTPWAHRRTWLLGVLLLALVAFLAWTNLLPR